MPNKIWFSVIQYVSGKEERVIFSNKDEAKATFKTIQYEQHDKVIHLKNGEKPFLLHLRNVEKITEPKEFQEDRSD